MEDKENHKRIAPLLRFFSSQSNEELISLDEYVENMKPEQKDIYFIAADSLSSAKNAPFLESSAKNGSFRFCCFILNSSHLSSFALGNASTLGHYSS